MSETVDHLKLFVIDLANKLLAKDNRIFIFASGTFRGELKSVDIGTRVPSAGFSTSGNYASVECVDICFTPGPRKASKVVDIANTKLTRVPQHSCIPVDAVDRCLFLKKIENNTWMLNVVSRNK